MAASPTAAKTGPRRLDATSETALSNALRALEPGQKGWISFDDYARLLSPPGEPSEWDEAGLRALGEFAAQLQHRSTPERDTVQQRILLHEFGRLPLETEFLCHFPTQRQRSCVVAKDGSQFRR